MGRRTPVLIAVLLIPLASIAAVRWVLGPALTQRARPQAPQRPATPRSSLALPDAASAPEPAIDPNLPLFIGETKRIAAQAVDDTAAARFDRAMALLAHGFEGTPPAGNSDPASAGSAAPSPGERLRLDLTGFDDLTYVDQILALANSRRVRSKTEAVDRFSDHVRRLRYEGGLVAACRRHRDPAEWAAAAERRGYLVDLSRFLPGARVRHLPAVPLAAAPASRGTTAAAAAACPPLVSPRRQAYIPLTALDAALPSLRRGDLFLLLGRHLGRGTPRLGVIDIQNGFPVAMQAQADQGVVRHPDLRRLATGTPGALGLVILRPIPNSDGRPGP